LSEEIGGSYLFNLFLNLLFNISSNISGNPIESRRLDFEMVC
jgi:hypothetical protein